MKLKLRPKYIAIFLLVVYIIGFVIANLAGMFGPPSLSLPKENIIDYRLTQEQEDYAVRLGKTVIALEYDTNCEICLQQKAFIEKIAMEQKDQIILQEISVVTTNLTKLRFVSYYGEKILRNPSENEIWDALCVLMFNPPAYCALREI